MAHNGNAVPHSKVLGYSTVTSVMTMSDNNDRASGVTYTLSFQYM